MIEQLYIISLLEILGEGGGGRGLRDLGRMAIYFQGAGEHW